MGRLILTDFKCVAETSEIGSDSPYFVFFVGKGRDPDAAKLVTIRQPQWDEDVNKGNVFHPNAVVGSVDDDALILCALMEEDLDTDITTGSGAFRKVRDHMRSVFTAHAADASLSVAQLAEQLIPEFQREIDAHRTNDDLVDVIHVPAGADLAQQGPFSMEGHGGRYLVWFAIE
ncbi:MAG TPA: hypothetical protein VNM90_10160 [Haliangium sp.]|nr:hypothetical protein [Haliangium sp.]